MTNNEYRVLVAEQLNATKAYNELYEKRSLEQGSDSEVVPVILTDANDELMLAKKRVDAAEEAVRAYNSHSGTNSESADSQDS